MAKGSPVYRREEQRTLWGLITVRQRNILTIAFVICVFLINKPHHAITHPEFQWTVEAVPTVNVTDNSDDGQDENGPTALTPPVQYPTYAVKDIRIRYTKKNANISWPEDANDLADYRYEVYLNGEKVGESSYGFFVYQYVPDSEVKSSSSGTYHLPAIYIIKLVVFMFFILIAYVDYNGTHLERYLWRMVKQYYEFKRIFKMPLVGIPVYFPIRKQTRFVIGSHSSLPELTAKSVVRKMPQPKVKSLAKEPVIEKVFTDISQPISFTSSSKGIEIVHPQVNIVLIRDKKGVINIVVRDK